MAGTNIQDKLIQLTKDLVSIPSEYPNEEQLCSYLYDTLRSQSFVVHDQVVEGKRRNIIVEKGNHEKSIILYAHIDTVKAIGSWKTDPHKPTLKGDKLYGLGSYDMKGGMAVLIHLIENLEPRHYTLKLVLCVDEEYIGKGVHTFMKSPHSKNIECVISPEPAFKNGLQGITTGRIGRSVHTVTLEQKPRHTMFYEPKYDLHLIYAKMLNRLSDLYKVDGQKKQFIFSQGVETEVSGMSVPSKLVGKIESSIIPPLTSDKIEEKIRHILKEIVLDFDSSIKCNVAPIERSTPFVEPYTISKDDTYLLCLKKSIKKITKKEPRPYFRSSVGDDNVFGAKGHTILGIGPIGDNAHSADEWVSVQSLVDLYSILKDFLERSDTLFEK